MNGTGGLSAFRWLFILEGLPSLLSAPLVWFFLPDYPETVKWLSPEEKAHGVVRLIEDAGEEEEDITAWAAFKMASKDYRVWLCILGLLVVPGGELRVSKNSVSPFDQPLISV